MAGGKKAHGVSRFRDELVLAIISKYAITAGGSPQSPDDFIIRHGSTPFACSYRMICALCKQRCSRMCPDCPFSPRLCQSTQKDCHSRWHTTQYAVQQSHEIMTPRTAYSVVDKENDCTEVLESHECQDILIQFVQEGITYLPLI